MFTSEEYRDAECAWKILKEMERLKQLLLQHYRYEFIEIKKKEEGNIESDENLPF